MSQSITFILRSRDGISMMHWAFFIAFEVVQVIKHKPPCFLLKLCTGEINVFLIYSLCIDCFSEGKIQLKADKSFKSHLKWSVSMT